MKDQEKWAKIRADKFLQEAVAEHLHNNSGWSRTANIRLQLKVVGKLGSLSLYKTTADQIGALVRVLKDMVASGLLEEATREFVDGTSSVWRLKM